MRLAAAERRRTRSWKTARALAILGILAIVAIARFAGTLLVVAEPIDEPDAIVSLASHEWERLPLAASLARQHPSARVLLTLPQPATVYNCHECGQRVDRLGAAGIASDRIHVIPIEERGTYGEAVACRGYLARESGRRLLIVTSPYHTRRALAVFRTVFNGTGVEIGTVPASAFSPARPRLWWLSPYDVWYVSYEWAAVAYYAVKFGTSV